MRSDSLECADDRDESSDASTSLAHDQDRPAPPRPAHPDEPCHIEDISARMEAEIAPRQSEERFRKTFELAAVGMVYMDVTGRILLANRAFRDLVGYEAGELVGRDIKSITHPDDLPEDIRRTDLILAGAASGYGMEKRYIRKNGQPVWVLAGGAVIRDDSGQPTHFIGQAQDISPQKEEETRLSRLRDDAEAASRAKSEFLATLSHEIRTPLSAILGFTEILKESKEVQGLSPRRQFEIDTIHENASLLLRIMNDLLDLARVEAGRLELDLGPCRPMSLASDVMTMMRPRASSRGLALSADIEGGVPEVIQSDETRLRQILINLVSNAIKFTETGAVGLRLRGVPFGPTGRGLEFSVSDTGPGMTSKEVAAAFEPFVRGKDSQARRAGGAGLGLPICRRLAERLGGMIDVETEPGRGSVFRLVIPIGVSAEPEETAENDVIVEPTVLAARCPSGLRLMLVEDNEANRFMCAYRLEEAGVDVKTATNGQEALDLVHESRRDGHPFDLILMDLQMPVMDGYEACRQLRGLGFDRPLIALTAYAMNEDSEECLKLGFDAHISKPIDWTRLMELIATLTKALPGDPA